MNPVDMSESLNGTLAALLGIRIARTMVWQTRVTDESGRLLSLTIQTQMVLG